MVGYWCSMTSLFAFNPTGTATLNKHFTYSCSTCTYTIRAQWKLSHPWNQVGAYSGKK